MTETATPVEVVCCYAPTDEKWLRKLEVHLSVIQRQGLVSLWHDRLVAPGMDWAKMMDQHLATASIILLLVSADFLASDYCYGVEMQYAVQRHQANEARVIPILVRSADLKGVLFEELVPLPSNRKPVTAWRDYDAAFADIAQGIRGALEKVQLAVETDDAKRIKTVKAGDSGDHGARPATAVQKTERTQQASFGAPFPEIWNIPRRHTTFFTGRAHVLEQLSAGFRLNNDSGMVPYQAIMGSGGIGKTQTAAEYAYRFRANYDAVFWIRAETQETLVTDVRAIAGQFHLPEKNARDQILVKAVQKWLRTHTQWLLILDNADDLSLVASFLPEAAAGHLLLTTRTSATIQFAQPLALTPLAPEDGAVFILRRAGYLRWDEHLSSASPVSAKAALDLSHLMSGLPLALEQAGAYIEDTGCGIQRYLALYRDFRSRLQHLHSGAIPDYPEPVACAWKVSWNMVEHTNAAAADLLRLCAFLSPDTIAEEIITGAAPFFGPRLGPVAGNPIDFDRAIGLLRRSSLLQREVDRDTDLPRLSIHRVIQQVLQDEMDPSTRQIWAVRAVQAVSRALPLVEWHVLQAHVQQCAHLIKQWNMTFCEAGNLLNYLKEKQDEHD